MFKKLGISNDAVEDAMVKADKLLNDFNHSILEYEDQIIEYLKAYGNWEDMTNSLIEATFRVTQDVIENIDDPIMEVQYTVNGYESDIQVYACIPFI